MAEPIKPIRSEDVPWTEFSEVPNFGIRYRHLTGALLGDNYRVGVAIEELAPGKRSNPNHYHMFEEEHVFVLDGAMTVHIGDRDYPLAAGDYAVFPAGLRAGHGFRNETEGVCRYVVLGENYPDEIAVYPDSNQVLVRSLGRRAIFDMTETRNYWKGQPTGLAVDAALPAGGVGPVAAADQEGIAPISSAAVQWTDDGNRGPTFAGRSKHLTFAALGQLTYHVGVLIEAPAPGKRLCPRHYHMLEEEHALILEGEVTLLLGDARIVMKPGDYVVFPAGQKVGHSFMNSGEGPCSYLMIGDRNPADVCVYPDSNKMLVRALRDEWDMFDRSATRKYWDGEERS